MTARLVLALSCLMSASGSFIAARPPAPNCLAEAIAQRDRDLHRRYLYETNGRHGIRGFGEEASNRSIVIPGSERLVVVWHGFMASPPEMAPLGHHLNEALGVTVYIPLIPGFGGGHRVADKFGLKAWRRSVRETVELGARCHGEVALVGYSIGGGLLADYLLRNAGEPSETILAVVLLSPHIETAGWMAPGLRSRPRAGLLHLLRSALRLRRIRLETLYRWSHQKYRDLEILLAHPEVYDESFSLKAGLAMLRLTRSLRGLDPDAICDVATWVAVSEADRTVGWRFTERFVSRHFPVATVGIRYPREDSVPHQIVVPEVNQRHQELFGAVATFLERHFEAPD